MWREQVKSNFDAEMRSHIERLVASNANKYLTAESQWRCKRIGLRLEGKADSITG